MNKKKHLTNAERIKIETLLSQGFSIRSIADFLEKSPSTISREIQKHSLVKIPNSCDCNDYNGCNVKHVCGSKDCNKKCRSCHLAKKYCEHYNKRNCEHWNVSSIKLCNGCTKRGYCRLEKHFYDAKKAHLAYCDTLVQSRNGFDLTLYDLTRINSIVTPRIKKGQSLYHIAKNNESELNISESTLRRLVMAGEMDAGIIDLPQAVKRRKRKVRTAPKLKSVRKIGHLYSDFRKYISENDVPVVQMDCVEGKKEDSQVLLTLYFTQFHMQLVFKLKEHTAKCVKGLFDCLERKLGKELLNSYVRKSLFGKSPYEIAITTLPKEFFTKLKLKIISESDVNLTPKLLKH